MLELIGGKEVRVAINQDYAYLIQHLEKKIQEQNKRLDLLEQQLSNQNSDWDNATLMRNWGVSKRTTKNYRDKGLEYYRLGGNGPIFYSFQAREEFKRSFKVGRRS